MKRYFGTGRLRLWTWMFMSMRLGFAALLALGMVSAGWAGVTLNGQPLDNVSDIMAATGHGLRKFPKDSLAVVRWNANSNNFTTGILGFESNKGNLAVSETVSDGALVQRNGGLHTAVSMRTDANGRHLGMTPIFDGGGNYNLTSVIPFMRWEFDGGGNYGFLSYAIGTPINDEDSDARFKDYGYTPVDTAAINSDIPKSVVMDVKSGLMMADGTELFVLVCARGHAYSLIGQQIPGDSQLAKIDDPDDVRAECSTLFFPVNSDCTGFDPVTMLSELTFSEYTLFGQIRLATGDFDNDGVRDELAIVSCEEKQYSIWVYKITKNGSEYTVKQKYEATIGSRGTDKQRLWIEGVDVAAGDFDGDGKTELAVAMNDLDGESSYLTVQTFKWNGSTFDSDWTNTKGDNDYRISNYKVYDNGDAHTYGLLIEAGDLDGDGKDEIVTVTARSNNFDNGANDQRAFLNLTAWKCSSGIKPEIVSNKYLKDANIYLPSNEHSNPQAYIDSYLPRDFSLAIGPFSGKLNGMESCSDVALSWAGDGTNTDVRAGPESRSQHVYLFKSVLDGSGKFQSFANPITLWEDTSVSGAVGIVAGDFLGETAILEDPAHMKLEAYKSYAAVLQVPPYHVDAIQAPWAAAAPAAPVNFTHLGRTVQHTNSQSGSTTHDTTATTRTFSEKGWNYGVDISRGKGISKKAVAGIGFDFSAGYSGGLTDSASQTQSEANKSSASFTMDTSLTTALTDALMYYQTDMHIWRYPVAKPVPSWLFGSLIEAKVGYDSSGEANGDAFVTYTLCDEPQTVMSESMNSSNYDDYAPSHEEGNLFSYPNSAARGMDNAQQTLGSGLNFTLNVTTAQTTKFTQSGSSTESQSSTSKHTETNGFHAKASLSGRFMTHVASLSANTSYAETYGTEIGDSSSFTKTWSDAEGITVSAPTGNLGFNTGYVDYTTLMQTYADAAGILNTAFGVNFSDGWLWKRNSRESQQSPYVEKPDPALVLPGRFNRKMARDAGGSYPVWEFNLDESSATKIRGMTFYNNVTSEYDTAALEQDWPYTISFPVYNASFVDAGEVTVEFGYESEGVRTRIDRKTVTLKGWNNADMNEPNKAVVSFEWTPDIAGGDYDFYVILDPDNLISEVHETWSHDTPDGNNNGYHPFSVVNKATAAGTIAVAADNEVSASDFELVFVNLEDTDQGPMSAAEFRSYAMNHSEDFRAAGCITYNGGDTLTNVRVDVMRDLEDGTRRHIANRHIPAIRPGKTRDFSFMVEHDKMSEGKLVIDLASDQGSFSTADTSGGTSSGNSSSSSGCSAGFEGLTLLLALALTLKRRTR